FSGPLDPSERAIELCDAASQPGDAPQDQAHVPARRHRGEMPERALGLVEDGADVVELGPKLREALARRVIPQHARDGFRGASFLRFPHRAVQTYTVVLGFGTPQTRPKCATLGAS